MNGQVELQLPADSQYVGLARLVVTTVARQVGMDDERVEDLKIAVSEATTNAIKAHRHRQQQHPVVLQFGATDNDSFEVTIIDAGPGFDPTLQNHERDWTRGGGLGLMIIQELADDVTFVRGEGMRVHMRFKVGLQALD